MAIMNPGIIWHTHSRRGRVVLPSSIDCRSRNYYLKYYSFVCTAERLFNCLPQYLRDANVSMLTIKSQLDELLSKVPDQPRLPGYSCFTQACSNTIDVQIQFSNV